MTDQPVPAAERPPTFANTGELNHHDMGCRCWPHVSERDALDAIAAVGLAEYRSKVAPAPTAPAGLREALERITKRGQRPAGRGEYIEHLVEEVHGPADPCDICAAIARPSEEPGLDVETLARAIDHHVHASYDVMQLNPDHLSYYSLASCGEAIAAEYARLAKEPGS